MFQCSFDYESDFESIKLYQSSSHTLVPALSISNVKVSTSGQSKLIP